MNYIFNKNVFTYEDIFNAYLNCRKRKRNTVQCLSFEMNVEQNLLQLLEEINTGTYKIGPTKVFTITDPKPREIWAANFRDRIIHHLIYNEIHEYFEKRFIEDTYSCIPNRGTLKAVQRAYSFLLKASQNNSTPVYYAKIDIKNFFVSIKKYTLWNKLKEVIDPDSTLGKLVYQNIYNNVIENYIISKNSDLTIVPKHKSLFNVNSSLQGLPIGNLTSQFYSNIYLDCLDKYCKHVLKIKYYIRYVDDVLIFAVDKNVLNNLVNKINTFLQTNLDLSLHANKIIINLVKDGINFLGQKIYPYGYKAGDRLISRFSEATLSGDVLSIQSYKGLLKHGKNYNLLEVFH